MSTHTLDPSIIQKIAYLARLYSVSPEEFIAKSGLELGAILEYVKQIQEIDTQNVNPFAGARTISIDDLRSDEPDQNSEDYARVRQNIISNFPNRQADLLVIPGIFENT